MKERQTQKLTKEKGVFRYEERIGAIKPYMEMGMSRRELDYALAIGARQVIPKAGIDEVIVRAHKNGDIRKLTEGEKAFIRQDELNITDDQAQDKVIKWLVAREMLVKRDAKIPEGRKGWNQVIEAMGDVDKPLRIIKNLLKRGASISDAAQIAKLENPETQEPVVRFAQEIAENGMIKEDALDHNQLIRICRINGIELQTFAHRIVLEAFFTARKALDMKEDMEPISKYNNLRDMFFNKEDSDENLSLAELEDFIAGIDVDQGYKEDDIGLYREGKDGERYRVSIGVSDDGEIIYDNTKFKQEREGSRERNANARAEGTQTKSAKAVMEREMNHPLDVKH